MAVVAIIAPDGREFDVPEENVQAALAAGWTLPGAPEDAPELAPPAPAPAAPRMVPVTAPDGREYEIPEANLQAAMDEGWEPVVSLGQKIRTGLEGAARGASLGISDAVQAGGAGLGTALGNALADDFGPGAVPHAAGPGLDAPALAPTAEVFNREASQEALQGVRTRQTASPEVALPTEFVGAVAPALLTGGGSAAASAARLTPAGYTSLVAARVQAHLAKKAGLGALGRVGSLAAGGAAESAMQSATRRVVDDLVEGDHEISAERMLGGLGGVLMDAGLGALTGGILGGAVEGAEAAYRMGRGALERAAAKGGAQADAPALQFDLSLGPAAAAEGAGPLTASELPTIADNSGSSIVQAARGAARDFGDAQQGAVRSASDDMDELLKLHDYSREHGGLAAKRRAAERMTGDMDQAANAFGRARQTFEEVELSAKSIIDEFGEAALQDRGGLAVMKRLETGARDAQRLMIHALENGDLGKAYMAVDDFKRLTGAAQNSKNPLIQARTRSLYDRVKLMAEDDVWGDLAQQQRAINPAITETIRRSKDDLVRRFFYTSGDVAADPFEQLTQFNRESFGALLNRIGDAEVEPAERALRLYVRAVAVDAEARAVAYGSQELVENAARMKQAASRFESKLNAVAYARRDSKAWEKLNSYATGTAGGVLRGAAKLGQLTLTPIQRMADAAVKQQRAVEAAAKGTRDVLLGAGSPKLLKSAITMNRVQGAVSQARALQQPDSPESGRLRQAVLELAQDDPALASVLDAKQRQVAAFLAAKAGPVHDDGDPFSRGPAPMDPVSAARLTRYVAAADDPGNALERVSQGLGTAEDIEVLQTLYPRLFDTYVQLVQAQLGRAKAAPTPAQRQQLNRATGIPMSREQQPEALLFLQRVANAPAEEQQPPGPKGGGMNIDPDEHFGPRSDQILAGEP